MTYKWILETDKLLNFQLFLLVQDYLNTKLIYNVNININLISR